MALSAHLCSSLSFPFSAKPSPSPSFSSLTLPRKKISAFSSGLTTTTVSDAEIEGEILSGEWPGNISILNFEDLCKYYEPVIFKEDAQPHTLLAEVMSTKMYFARPDQLLEEVDHIFSTISGLPVVNKDLKCIGVMSKKDRTKAVKGLQSTVGEVMTSPPITLFVDRTVNDAAVLMLKSKVHRIPIVNEANQVVGIVTRTDIFKALENGDE